MRFLLFIRYRETNHLACQRSSGFTLIELLLVISLLAVLAIAAINAFDGNEEQARYNITRLEMVELQKALLQFRRDTGEFPCRSFRTGVYSLNTIIDPDDGPAKYYLAYQDQPNLPENPDTVNGSDWEKWCQEAFRNSAGRDIASNALYMLNDFPYFAADFPNLLWNRDTQKGWNGSYISLEGLTDGWGNPYLLLDPELDYSQHFACLNNSGAYAVIDDDLYDCQSLTNESVPANYNLPANVVRIVSTGPNGDPDSLRGDYSDLANDDLCAPAEGSDDLVLCLLR
ncbi:prepilin-type N-terminal cleavage/methylation domain-containing protein [Methylophaga sp. OBS3]|uniref:prepilin-type N-terminal cleavage/methylation domain-containing protein n=1 Tax=Methylophaga sp. OBS3 TaxID=2991934 RepID=UPI00224FD818|nr:prepilin-type N-terminal cleavage/methylation domain-containing protein [Methylophaga sp. OBS3]MCX4189161.1 prepilin-type N-terminal cleavage/methylation domain-containing protein [Methylophaga sp. OBS3]